MPRCASLEWFDELEQEDPVPQAQFHSTKFNFVVDKDRNEWYPNRVNDKHVTHYMTGSIMTYKNEKNEIVPLRWNIRKDMDLLKDCIIKDMRGPNKDPVMYVFNNRAEKLVALRHRFPNMEFSREEAEIIRYEQDRINN